jgi:cell volume regulation protein A
VNDAVHFGWIIALVAAALLLAVLASRVSERIRIPAPALFLIGAALAADLFPSLGSLSVHTDERLVTVALIFILFDGGMHIGWTRFKPAAGAVIWVGVAGTVVTAGAMALAAHYLFGFDWRVGLLIGTALAPTDPAVVFSVLGRREIAGRAGTVLEGESGANDPVGIALMLSLIGAGGGGWSAVGSGVGQFALQLAVGGAVGAAGGWLLLKVMRHIPLPNEALYSVRAVGFAALIYGVGAALHGSGFLAVFLAGIIVGDARAPYKAEIERFAAGLATLAEVVAFTVLGLTVSLRAVVHGDVLWVGLALAALLILVVRPLLVGALLIPIKLNLGERTFVLWSGLKGAVPILLAMFILGAHVHQARRVYEIVFLVVLVSVIVQGGLVPTVAKAVRLPMRVVDPEPWALGMRFADEPDGLHRHWVEPGSPADGCPIAELDIGESAWISMVSRDGRLVQVRGSTVLMAGDEVLALADPGIDLSSVFAGETSEDRTSEDRAGDG